MLQAVKYILTTEKDALFRSFTSQLSHEFRESTVKSIYSLLFDKMANLRKKDMEKSMDRFKNYNKCTSVALNLRDELKPAKVIN